MTTPLTNAPLSITIKHDVTDDYRALGDYNAEYGLDRAGSINIDLKSTENGKQVFQIVLVDRLFRDSGKPLRRAKPSIINLNVDALFEVVQKCRMRWEQALACAKRIDPGAGDVTGVAHYLYEEEWKRPVDAATFHVIAGELAVAGARLFEGIFESNRGTALDDIADKLREALRTGERVLTVNSTDFHIPWRMLYTHPHPNERLADDGSNFNPRGFWGYQHIIEQFTNDDYPLSFRVVAKNGQLGFGAALHEKIDRKFNVECLKRHHDFVQSNGARLKYVEWTKRAEVINSLSVEPFGLQVIYFLCHAEGAGTTAKPNLQPPILQLSDGTIDAVELRESIHHRFKGSAPFVFINACRGGHFGTTVSHNFTFASEFLEQGAVCLVGPQIEVPAVFAGEFGKRFFERIMSNEKPPPAVGVILRDLTRFMWEERNPLGLVYSLYAGADCHIHWEREAEA